MPARTYQISGGSKVMIFTCDGCGAPAGFGTGVSLMAALNTGDVKKAGRWWCGYRDGVAVCLVNPAASAKPAANMQILSSDAPALDLFGAAR